MIGRRDEPALRAPGLRRVSSGRRACLGAHRSQSRAPNRRAYHALGIARRRPASTDSASSNVLLGSCPCNRGRGRMSGAVEQQKEKELRKFVIAAGLIGAMGAAGSAIAGTGQCYDAYGRPVGPVYDTDRPNYAFLDAVVRRGGTCTGMSNPPSRQRGRNYYDRDDHDGYRGRNRNRGYDRNGRTYTPPPPKMPVEGPSPGVNPSTGVPNTYQSR